MDFDNPSYFSVSKDGQSPSTSSSSVVMDCHQPGTSFERSTKRSFLRSISTNSADSNKELLIMGEPRLSDLAPDLAYRHSSRSESMRSRRDEVRNDVSYFPLPTSEEQADELSGDEVFLTEESARYYNVSAMKRTNQRRHSIGTFVLKERTNSMVSSTRSFKEDFPQREKDDIDDHSLRHASFPRKRCSRCTNGAPKRANMDDILIVSLKSSEAAALWVDYFSNYFDKISKQANKRPFKVQYVGAEDILGKSAEDLLELQKKSSGVKLQLVVVCPSFMDFIAENSEECSHLGKMLLADRALALLLGVTDDELTEVHKKVLPTFFQWQRQMVGQDQDENFTKEFLGQAMAILSRIWKQQSSVIAQEKACFSITPKKIRQGQNSVFVLLTYPLQKEDTVKISVERDGELHEVRTVKRRNPYIMKFQVPERLTEVTAIVNVLVEKNGSIIGSRPLKCESKLRELEQCLRTVDDPVEFMCQTLGFSPADKDHLDSWLVNALQRNMPPHFNLLANNDTPFAASVQVHKHSHEEYPTLLHFAAKFGLEKLAMQLLECPGADLAYEIRNNQTMTPLEIAENNGFPELASMLRGYMNMNEFTTMYSQLKEMSLNPKPPDVDDDGYMVPKNCQEFYKMCPAPRPVESTSVTTPSSDWSGTYQGYMAMNTPAPSTSKEDITVPVTVHSPPPFKFDDTKTASKETLSPAPLEVELVPKYTAKNKQKLETMEDKVQRELLEIINDFKNNVHSISQVEKLVEEWKNRNDVQKSFKEKQQQLAEMRMRYEQIQSEMKRAMKKPTPFDRIKKMFWRNKDKQQSEPILVTTGPTITIAPTQRPISSLSTSSSGSSGRMSTISGCSLGDSGTHSDNEERKAMLASHSEDDFRNKLNKAVLELNYSTVPAPKPVKLFPGRNTFETIQEKPLTRPNNLSLTDEFYIQFPPSGLPVPGLQNSEADDSPKTNDYMNVSANSTPQGHEYMNFKAPMAR